MIPWRRNPQIAARPNHERRIKSVHVDGYTVTHIVRLLYLHISSGTVEYWNTNRVLLSK